MDEHRVHAARELVWIYAIGCRECRLRIEIDQKNTLTHCGQGCAKIGNRGGLADTTLLIGDHDAAGQGLLRAERFGFVRIIAYLRIQQTSG